MAEQMTTAVTGASTAATGRTDPLSTIDMHDEWITRLKSLIDTSRYYHQLY